MRKTNYQQMRKQRESSRKARQTEKLARRTGTVATPDAVGDAEPGVTDAPVEPVEPVEPAVKPT